MEPTSTDDASAAKKTLTPAEVHNVAFKKPPIGKRGYDEEEVDYFLDVVEKRREARPSEDADRRAGRAHAARA